MKLAIATLFSGKNKGYFKGAVVLGESLKKYTPESTDMVAIVENGGLNTHEIYQLKMAGWKVRIVDPIRAMPCKFTAARWKFTFTKLHVFNLVEYEKVLFLDADCLVVGDFHERIFRTKINQDEVAACWVTRNCSRFNSGVMLLKPSAEVFSEMVRQVTTVSPKETLVSGSDQSFLNKFFGKFIQIPDKYNQRHFMAKYSDVRIAHLRPHPWTRKRYNNNSGQFYDKWTKLHNRLFGSGRAQEIVKRIGLRNSVGVEVGTLRGQTANTILTRCPNTILYMVDMWDGEHYTNKNDKLINFSKEQWLELKLAAYKISKAHGERCIVYEMSSLEASKKLDNLDYVFIDADHTYKSCKEDIVAWLPKIKSGGWIGGHDYSPRWPGVVKAVKESFSNVQTGLDATWFVKL